MDNYILLSQLNDFIFCPVSIYFHNLYYYKEKKIYQSTSQTKGTHAHIAIDKGTYRYKKNIITGMDVFCEQYGLIGKIDILDQENHLLIERKKLVKFIYDGYVFQLYGQYFSLKEMGYSIDKIRIHSLDDNKNYDILLPEQDEIMKIKFEKLIKDMRTLSIESYVQDNEEKCKKCIYEPACDRSLL